MKFEAMRFTMSKLPRPARRKLLHSRPAQYEMIACHAGKTESGARQIVAKGFEQYAIPIRGPVRHSDLPAFRTFRLTTSIRF